MNWSQRLERHTDRLAIALLFVFVARLLDTAVRQSATFDEVLHILQGVLYWRESALYAVVRNPPLVNALIGLPVNFLAMPDLPPDLARYANQDWLAVSKIFMWQSNANGLLLIWLGRLAIISLALFMAALVYRWAGQMKGDKRVGLLALFLVTFDPNILAHGTLATTDMGTTFFILLAAYLLWRYWRAFDAGQKTLGPLLWAGIGVGCALSAKFSGLVIVMALLLLEVYRYLTLRPRKQKAWRQLLNLCLLLLTAVLVFLAIYRFQFATLRLDFALQRAHQLGGHSAYLLGQLSREGWWYYLPLVFLVKTPLPLLIILALSLWQIGHERDFSWATIWPLLLAAGVFGAGVVSSAGIGYRYLLPMLPLLTVTAGRLAVPVSSPRRVPAWLTPLLLLWIALVSIAMHPQYLATFNVLAGGPDNGWRVAVDSNIDWGQDLARVGEIMKERGAPSVFANWLGTAPLEVYGIAGETLDGWPWPGKDPLLDSFYPPWPAPGLYALSVTQLLGVYLEYPEHFAYFQKLEPDAKAGYSIFLYDVPAEGAPVGLGLSGIGLGAISKSDFKRAFAGNDVRPRWFDARSSFLWPGGDGQEVWTAVGDGHLPQDDLLRGFYPAAGPELHGRSADGLEYGLYHWPQPPLPEAALLDTDFGTSIGPEFGLQAWEERPSLGTDAVFDQRLVLLGTLVPQTTVNPGDTLTMLSAWTPAQALPRDTPQLKIFVHLLDAQGQVVAQHDGLDVRLAELQAGDWFAQKHMLVLPEDLPAGQYGLQIGVYDPETGIRLTVPTSAGPVDKLLLSLVKVTN